MSLINVLKQGPESWKEWRNANPNEIADLRGAPLSGADLLGINLSDVNLSGANLTSAVLRSANLSRSDLRGALLTGADVRGASFCGAILCDMWGGMGNSVVDITEADFTGATFGWTVLGDVYLNRITGIGQIKQIGPSYIATSTLEFTATEIAAHRVMRTDVESFLRGAGVLPGLFEAFEQATKANAFRSAFISYSSSDRDFARWLYDQLESRGVRCWLDEKHLLPGERILDALAKAISSHDRILLCCSKASLMSWWVQDEIRKALEIERVAQANLRIIPLLLDDYLLDEWDDGMASELRSRRGINFKQRVGHQFKEELDLLLGALKKGEEKADRTSSQPWA